MTSNLGTEYVSQSGSLGFLESPSGKPGQADREKIEKALKDAFRPEFLNRIDEIITFSPLTREQMMEIVDLQMADVARRLRENGLEVNLTESARSWLAEKGYNPDFGARPLTRALQKHIESPLSKKLLAGEFERGDVITVDVDDEDQDQLDFVHEQE